MGGLRGLKIKKNRPRGVTMEMKCQETKIRKGKYFLNITYKL